MTLGIEELGELGHQNLHVVSWQGAGSWWPGGYKAKMWLEKAKSL